MIIINNDGAAIASTNYWETEHAAAGLCYLSGNAGTYRLLVPEAAEGLLMEMSTGKRASIERSVQMPGQCVDVVFEDGSDTPFSIAIDRRQIDRALDPGSCRLAVWTARGRLLELPCTVRPI